MNKTTDGCDVGNLIDLSVASPSSKKTTQDNAEVPAAAKVSAQDSEKKYGRLCGYLNKQSSRNLLRTFRKRWFVLSPDSCKLYYYKSSQEQAPLGEIDISKASFNFDVANRSKGAFFTVSVPGKEYTLEAKNRQACLFWLQELQKYRRSSSLHQTEKLRGKSEFKSNLIGLPKSGLLGNASDSGTRQRDDFEEQLMIPVDYPCDIIGDENGMTNNNPLSLAQQKLSNLKNQVLKNRQNKSLNDLSSQAHMENKQSEESASDASSSVFFDMSPASSTKDLQSAPSPAKSRSQSFLAFRTKITESFRKTGSADDDEQNPPFRFSWRNSCAKCQMGEEKIGSLMDEITTYQDEVATSRTLINDLQQQLDIVLKEKETLFTEDVHNVERERLIDSSTPEGSQQKQQVDGGVQNLVLPLRREIAELQKQNDVLREMLQRKDNTIVSLTKELFDLETEKRDSDIRLKASHITPLPEDKAAESLQDLNDMEYLNDAVRAFEIQNKFLNKEVLELNQLRDESEQREQILTIKCSEWEARCCQIQSKLLFLLKELHKPDEDGKIRELVSRLLEEAMVDAGTDTSLSLPKWSVEVQYDDLGFNWKWGKDDLLSTKAKNLKQRSEDITNRAKDDAEITSWRVKWDNFMVVLADKELQRTAELKVLLRMGVPREHKGKIWKGCVDSIIKYYKMDLGPQYYETLLNSEEFASRLDPSSKQIELDLLRTLPNNRHYESLDSDGIPKLRRVLLAYSRHNPVVGYCQGLNRLAAIALLFMNEEDAFWCLVAIIKYLMPEGYYTRTLIAAQVDQRVLKDLMADKIPRLHLHLEQHNIDLSLFTFNWFLTVFVDNVPAETYLRIWDVFLYEGSKVLFRYALAFFKYCENDILQLKDYISISRYLRGMAEKMSDIKRLNQIAFGELNPFPQRAIDSKRAQHMTVVKAQLDEFELLRSSLPKTAEKELDIEFPSEDD